MRPAICIFTEFERFPWYLQENQCKLVYFKPSSSNISQWALEYSILFQGLKHSHSIAQFWEIPFRCAILWMVPPAAPELYSVVSLPFPHCNVMGSHTYKPDCLGSNLFYCLQLCALRCLVCHSIVAGIKWGKTYMCVCICAHIYVYVCVCVHARVCLEWYLAHSELSVSISFY